MKEHKKLIAWQKSKELSILIYKRTNTFPESEKFGLTNQIRRAASSIPMNIAEGYGRSSDKELIRYLYISKGSAYEVDTQLELSKELGFLSEKDFVELTSLNDEIIKMLSSLIYRRENMIDSFNKNPK